MTRKVCTWAKLHGTCSQGAKSRNRSEKSFMYKHQQKEHQGAPGTFTAKVTGTARDCLTRQVREAVLIRRCKVPVMNSKTEWHQPALFRVQNEIYRGWAWNGCGRTDNFVLDWGVAIDMNYWNSDLYNWTIISDLQMNPSLSPSPSTSSFQQNVNMLVCIQLWIC